MGQLIDSIDVFPIEKIEFEQRVIGAESIDSLSSLDAYSYIQEKAADNYIGRLWKLFMNYLNSLFDFGRGPGWRVFKYFLIGGGLLLLFLTVLRMQGVKILSKNDRTIIPEIDGMPKIRDVKDLKDQLRRAIDSRDYKSAAHLIYLEALIALNDRDQIRIEKYKINSEYVSEINNDDIRSVFVDLTSRFEYCYYGDFPISDEYFNETIRKKDELLRELNMDK